MKKIALTFDDAPECGVTDQILDILDQYGSQGGGKATFFIQGNRINSRHAIWILKRIKRSGHEIGNHSWSHARFCELSSRKIWWELWKTDCLLFFLGIRTVGVRTPYGEQNERIEKLLGKRRTKIKKNILWTIHSHDSSGATAEEITKTLKHTEDGAIVLCHAWSRETGKALESFLGECGKEIEFVKISELIKE